MDDGEGDGEGVAYLVCCVSACICVNLYLPKMKIEYAPIKTSHKPAATIQAPKSFVVRIGKRRRRRGELMAPTAASNSAPITTAKNKGRRRETKSVTKRAETTRREDEGTGNDDVLASLNLK